MRICYLHLFFTSLHLNLSISPQPILNRLYFPPCMILVKDTSDSDLYKYSSWSPVCTLLCLSLAHSVVVYLSWKHFLSWSSKGLLFLCDPMDGSMPGFSVHHHLPEFVNFMFTELMMSSNHFILCHPLLLLPSIFPSIRVFSSKLALYIRWPKDWSFSVSIISSNEYSGLISFRID